MQETAISVLRNESFQIVMAGIMPAILLVAYICWKDRKHPEPVWWILYATMMGCGAAVVSTFLAAGIEHLPLWALVPEGSTLHAWATAFLLAAVPEEVGKWWFLTRIAKSNPYFDERMDAIVYAVCIGMGFAGLENVLYLFNAAEDWMQVAAARSLLSVPGHFAFAVLMGYYYGKVHFARSKWKKLRLGPMVLLAPIVAHGIYDGLLMMNHDLPAVIAAAISIAFIVFLIRLHRYSRVRIKRFEGR